jgi:nicotinamide-nucleotide amidase
MVISSGDEIITGQLLDTNSRFLAERLMDSGILPVEHVGVPDELPALTGALRRACEMAPLVVISGGLGPTEGDLTRQALAEMSADALVLDEAAERAIAGMLSRRGREMTERQRRQAYRPSRSVCLPNAYGTAPGLHAVVPVAGPHRSADVFCLPGPPGELRPMWEREVLPRLRPDPLHTVVTRLLHIVGIAEADCVTRLGDLTRRDRPTGLPLVGITASGGVLTLRIRYEGRADRKEAQRLVDEVESLARTELADHVAAAGPGAGGGMLARAVVEKLRGDGASTPRMLAVVESCTGGMLGEMLTAIPGSSAVFVGGFITYANRLKESLGVDAEALRRHGAVSRETAEGMAACGLERSGADYCLSITGIAGPEGGTATKPVGTVHIGLAARAGLAASTGASRSRLFLFTGDREDVRRRACVSALAMLHFHMAGRKPGEPRLLWEVDRAGTA